MSDWRDWIFGNLPPRPQQPASRAAMPGLQPYQQMPDPKYSVTDARSNPFDHAAEMKDSTASARNYTPSMAGGTGLPAWSDPMLDAGPTLSEGASDPNTFAPYKTSFKPNWRPPPSRQAPYNPFPSGTDEPFGTGAMGPNLPRGPTGTSVDPEMPYMGPHLPISPGDPGWTSPPSPSGPHNPQGDPSRPGYDSPEMPMNASQPSYQQMINYLQSWRGGAS